MLSKNEIIIDIMIIITLLYGIIIDNTYYNNINI